MLGEKVVVVYAAILDHALEERARVIRDGELIDRWFAAINSFLKRQSGI